jgi:hypothetical protein
MQSKKGRSKKKNLRDKIKKIILKKLKF